MKIKLVFEDWHDQNGESVYQTTEGIVLSAGDLHSGTTFDAEINLDADQAAELRLALKRGFHPVFYVAGE